MSMGSREGGEQRPLWVTTSELSRGEGHLFYLRLNELLGRHGFDRFVERLVEEKKIFAETLGRPSIPPGTYMRMMFVGFFEGLSSERAIAWKCADSLSLREFLGYGLTQATPDHSTLSGLRRKFPEEVHREIFDWVLKVAQEEGLLKGRKVAIDATTLEANAAMRTIVRRADGASYQKYLKKLAKAEGIKDPTPEDLGRMDRKRKGKKVSNKQWKSSSDPDARITKMKDGTTHLAHKAEHAVDVTSGVIVAAEIHPADSGDTTTLPQTLTRADAAVQKTNTRCDILEVVADRGYHSSELLGDLHSGATAEEAARLEEAFPASRQARSQAPTAGLLPQPSQNQERRRQTPSPQARANRREEFRPRLRDRGDAPGSSARSSQYPQALPGSRRRPQSRHRSAMPHRPGHTARLPGQKGPPHPRLLVASLLDA
jgi:transposase